MEKISLRATEKEILMLCEFLNQIRLLATTKKKGYEVIQQKTYAKYQFLIKKLAVAVEDSKNLEPMLTIINETLHSKKIELEESVMYSIKKKIYNDLVTQLKKMTSTEDNIIKKEEEEKQIVGQEKMHFKNEKPSLPNIEEEVQINIAEKEWTKTKLLEFIKNNPDNKPKRILEEKAKQDLNNYIAKLRKVNPKKLEKMIFSFLPKPKI